MLKVALSPLGGEWCVHKCEGKGGGERGEGGVGECGGH